MTFQELKTEEETYLMHTYNRFQIALERGEGATLWDVEGKSYIDLTSGIGVNCLGHNHEGLIHALTEQAHKVMHVSNLYYTEPMARAAKALVTSCGMGKVFFSNSGAEANEGMITPAVCIGAGRGQISQHAGSVEPDRKLDGCVQRIPLAGGAVFGIAPLFRIQRPSIPLLCLSWIFSPDEIALEVGCVVIIKERS